MAILVEIPYPIFTGLDGLPLEDGYVYVGEVGLNPETYPVQAYWDRDLTIPAANIRTKGGYPALNGSPGRIYVDGNYSILVKDKKGQTLSSVLDATREFTDLTGLVDIIYTQGVLSWDEDQEYYAETSFAADEGYIWKSKEGTVEAPNEGNKPSENRDKWERVSYRVIDGIPQYDSESEYLESTSFCQDEGMIWSSNFGTALIPNVGNKPSTNQDKWYPVGAPSVEEAVEDEDTYTPTYKNAQLVADTSVGDVSVTIEDGKFLNQEIILSNNGAGFATYTHSDFSYGIIVDTDHNPVIKWVSDGVGGLKWGVGSQVTADYSDNAQKVILYSNARMIISGDVPVGGLSSTITVYPLVFTSSEFPIFSYNSYGGNFLTGMYMVTGGTGGAQHQWASIGTSAPATFYTFKTEGQY